MTAKDTLIGIYHFLGDRTPDDIPVVLPKPRKNNPFIKEGKALVVKQLSGGNINTTLEDIISKIGGLQKIIHSGDKVFIKPNFNSPDPFPASTDLSFLQSVIEILKDTGANITIGESSGGVWRPTHNVFNKLGLFELAKRFNVELIAFEDRPKDWVKVNINGDYLKSVTMPLSAYEADKIIYLPCLKTHRIADFSGALKLAFGFVHPGERRAFHLSHLKNKIAEVSLCWQPDLIIMDARKAFISGGPDHGELAEPCYILASGDLVAIDIEGINILNTYQAVNSLPSDPSTHPQITTALKYNIGVGKSYYTVIP